MSDAETPTLDAFLVFKNGKTSPDRSDDASVPVYGSNGIIGFSEESNAPQNTIVIGRVGTYCGSLHFSASKCWVTDNAIICNARNNEPTRFWFSYLTSRGLNNYRAGSGQPLLNQGILKQIPASVPPHKERLAIASLLGALDDKIELNRRMNETLEGMARALFKDWFVDFGPTRAKMEGRPPYLPPDLWDLFPDNLNPDTGLPDGWELSEIGQEVDAVGGATPSTKETTFWEGGTYCWATPKDLSKLSSLILFTTERKITDQGTKKISSGLLPKGTVLLSSRAPVGYLAIAETPTAINQGFIAMVCNKRLSNIYVLFWCQEKLEHIKSISGGSTFAEISKKTFRPIPITVPTKALLEEFEAIVRPLYKQIVSNARESLDLAQTRDLLLPRLMSGEIHLKEAKIEVGAMV